MVLLVFLTTFYFISPGVEAAVTINTSTSATATQYSHQRKTWYDGTLYWAAIMDTSTSIRLYYSSNGSTWTQNSSAAITGITNLSDFTIYGDSSYIFLAYCVTTATSTCSAVQAGSAQSYPASNNWAWSAAPASIGLGSVIASSTRTLISMTKDTNNKLRVTAKYFNGGTNYQIISSVSTNANDISVWTASNINPATTTSTQYANVASLSSGDIYSVISEGSVIKGYKNTAGTWDTNPVLISSGTSGYTTNASLVSNSSTSEAYLSYIDSGGKTIFQKMINSNNMTSTKINDSGNPGTIDAKARSIVRTSNGTLYSFIDSGGTCGVWKSSDGLSWVEVDSAHHPTCTNTSSGNHSVAIAVDNTDKLHLVYLAANGDSSFKYNTLTSDTYGTVENIPIGAAISFNRSVDISIDSNNVPHVVFEWEASPPYSIKYSNRVGGSWDASPTTVNSTNLSGSSFNASITLDKDDKPQILYDDPPPNPTISASIGNQNDASSFTIQDLNTNINNSSGSVSRSSLAVDKIGNTWATYIDSATNYVTLLKHNYGDPWSTWQAAVTNSNVGKETSVAVSGNTVYIIYINSLDDIAVDTYNGSTWGGENTLQNGTFTDVSVRWAYNNNNQNKPLDYLYSDGTDIYYNQMPMWSNQVILDSNAGNAYTSITLNTSTNDLYIFWIRSNTTYYSKSSSPYTSWSSPASSYSTSTNTWLTSAATISSALCPFYMFTSGTGSPYDIKFDKPNCSPNAPTISTPTSGVTGVSLTPVFTLKSTDADNDYIRYRIYLYQSDCSTAVGSSPFTEPSGTPQTGWTGQDAGAGSNTAYAGNFVIGSSTLATYTYQGTLTAGTVYCWKADAIDPGGSNSYSTASSTQLFTTNYTPTVPTLTQPVNSSTNVSLTPEFRLYSTDPDNDYLKYKIDVCSTNTCSSIVRTIDQTSLQTGWTGQSVQTANAYTSGQTAIHLYQTAALSPSTQYWWRAYAVDPGGIGTFSAASGINTFTTVASATPNQVKISGGNVNIGGGVIIKP
ncbi:MAG: hypothetical protein JWO47_111 [Candidatus Saccharibacteria bacterium]|nr:hypothetical protein [Candidatus Saccharibacteria bacterium]